MAEPKRVLHVFSALDSGGVANFVMNAYRRIDRERVQFDFALTSGKKSMSDDEAQSLGGRIFYFDPDLDLEQNLRDILTKDGPFDCVHSHVFFRSGLVLRTAKRCGVPIRIAHAHNAHTGERASLLRRAYETAMRRLIRKNATAMVGCSEKACRYVFGDGCMSLANVAVIPDGIDCDRFAFDAKARECVRRQYGLEGKFVVGHVGHFNPAKNHGKILSVFAEILMRRSDAALLLVGDGELEASVRKAAERFPDGAVVFAGAHRDVENMYRAMDVFLFPSRYEGFGMAMIEAQASGLACVASDVVPEDTNADGRAVYLPLEADDAAWAEAVLSAPGRTEDGLRSVKRRFDIADTADRLSAIYLRDADE